MESVLFEIKDLFSPDILFVANDYLIVYKPPKMHSAPGKGSSLVEWCVDKYPELQGLPKGEGGLLHRLDFETNGLVVFARNQMAFDLLFEEQKNGDMIKEYAALVSMNQKRNAGFPPFNCNIVNFSTDNPQLIESKFRPYGPGSKEVRPVVDDISVRKIYSTEITQVQATARDDILYVRVTIKQGFRHQIRCHLAWAGFPVLNDTVYGGKINAGERILALRAKGISFTDPNSGEKVRYELPDLE